MRVSHDGLTKHEPFVIRVNALRYSHECLLSFIFTRPSVARHLLARMSYDVIIKATLRCISINFMRRFWRHDCEISDTQLVKAACLSKQAHGMFSIFTQYWYQYKYINPHTQDYRYDLKPTVVIQTRFPSVQHHEKRKQHQRGWSNIIAYMSSDEI